MSTEKVKEIEAKIADLQARMPVHSTTAAMLIELEELEEELEKAKKEG